MLNYNRKAIVTFVSTPEKKLEAKQTKIDEKRIPKLRNLDSKLNATKAIKENIVRTQNNEIEEDIVR